MTLSASLSTATSSLRAIQTKLAVAASNIANADDVNYTAKTASQSSVVTGTLGTGVQITGIDSKVSSYLVKNIVEATAENSAAQILYSYLESLSSGLGTLSSDGSGDTLATQLSDLESALDELATTPESTTVKTQVVTDLQDSAATLQDASAQVQDLRSQADSDIAGAVETANDALHQIDDLNEAITRAQAAGETTSDLEDQRNAALQTVAEQIGITYYTGSNGAVTVYTESGQLLVGSQVYELSFTAANGVSASDSYPSTLSGISVNGKDITSSISSGALSSLVTLRDSTLPAVQDELDTLAVTLRDTINAIANEGSASPPPNSLTGSESYSSTDALSASGTLTVAITDSDGNLVSNEDIDLSSYSTVGDLVTALNGISGLSASLDSSGHLVLETTSSGNGLAVSGGTIGSENFSGYFGLNDVLVGDSASNIEVKSELADDSTLFPVGTLSSSLTVGEAAVTSGSGTLAQSMADALRNAEVTDTAADIVSAVATMLSSAESAATSTETSLTTLVDSFSSQYGVNTDEETALISELQNAYAASAQILSAVQSMFDDLINAVS